MRREAHIAWPSEISILCCSYETYSFSYYSDEDEEEEDEENDEEVEPKPPAPKKKRTEEAPEGAAAF